MNILKCPIGAIEVMAFICLVWIDCTHGCAQSEVDLNGISEIREADPPLPRQIDGLLRNLRDLDADKRQESIQQLETIVNFVIDNVSNERMGTNASVDKDLIDKYRSSLSRNKSSLKSLFQSESYELSSIAAMCLAAAESDGRLLSEVHGEIANNWKKDMAWIQALVSVTVLTSTHDDSVWQVIVDAAKKDSEAFQRLLDSIDAIKLDTGLLFEIYATQFAGASIAADRTLTEIPGLIAGLDAEIPEGLRIASLQALRQLTPDSRCSIQKISEIVKNKDESILVRLYSARAYIDIVRDRSSTEMIGRLEDVPSQDIEELIEYSNSKIVHQTPDSITRLAEFVTSSASDRAYSTNGFMKRQLLNEIRLVGRNDTEFREYVVDLIQDREGATRRLAVETLKAIDKVR